MKFAIILAVLCVGVNSTLLPTWRDSLEKVRNEIKKDAKHLRDLEHDLEQRVKDALRHMKLSGEMHDFEGNGMVLKDFKWENCGSSNDALQIKSLSLSPDPIKVPGNVTVAIDANLATAITSPTQLSLEMYKKVFGVYVKIPCENNIGSCDYKDLCPLLQKAFAKKGCPDVFKKNNIPCECPFAANNYNFPSYS